MKYQFIIFIFIFFHCVFINTSFAEDSFDLADDQEIISERNSNTGLKETSRSIDHNGFSFSLFYHLPANPFNLQKLNGFEFNLQKNFSNSFFMIKFTRMNMLFNEVVETTNLYTITSPVQTTIEPYSSIGIGYGIRSHIFRDIFRANKSFETMSFSLSYDSLNEQVTGDIFNGLGFQIGLGLYKLLSSKIYYGLKADYHLSNLRRAPLNSLQTTSERSLTLSWLSLGINLSMYLE